MANTSINNNVPASNVTLSGGGNIEDSLSTLTTKVNDTVSKTNGGTFEGNISINRANGTTTTDGTSGINLGNAIASGVEGNSYGRIAFYGKGSNYTIIQAPDSTTTRDIKFPDASGTVALTSDINVDGTYFSGQAGFTVSLATLCSNVLATNKHKIYFINASSQITDWPSTFPAKNYIFVELTNYSSVTTINIYAGPTLIATGRRIANGAISLENLSSPEMYTYKGALLHGGTSTIFGYGVAQINLSSGIATIDFETQITVNDSTSTFDYGIDRDYFTTITGKTITPIAGGIIHYYTSTGAINTTCEGFGGTSNAVSSKYWGLSRMYTQSGTIGQWGSSIFSVDDRIIGRVYGTY